MDVELEKRTPPQHVNFIPFFEPFDEAAAEPERIPKPSLCEKAESEKKSQAPEKSAHVKERPQLFNCLSDSTFVRSDLFFSKCLDCDCAYASTAKSECLWRPQLNAKCRSLPPPISPLALPRAECYRMSQVAHALATECWAVLTDEHSSSVVGGTPPPFLYVDDDNDSSTVLVASFGSEEGHELFSNVTDDSDFHFEDEEEEESDSYNAAEDLDLVKMKKEEGKQIEGGKEEEKEKEEDFDKSKTPSICRDFQQLEGFSSGFGLFGGLGLSLEDLRSASCSCSRSLSTERCAGIRNTTAETDTERMRLGATESLSQSQLRSQFCFGVGFESLSSSGYISAQSSQSQLHKDATSISTSASSSGMLRTLGSGCNELKTLKSLKSLKSLSSSNHSDTDDSGMSSMADMLPAALQLRGHRKSKVLDFDTYTVAGDDKVEEGAAETEEEKDALGVEETHEVVAAKGRDKGKGKGKHKCPHGAGSRRHNKDAVTSGTSLQGYSRELMSRQWNADGSRRFDYSTFVPMSQASADHILLLLHKSGMA